MLVCWVWELFLSMRCAKMGRGGGKLEMQYRGFFSHDMTYMVLRQSLCWTVCQMSKFFIFCRRVFPLSITKATVLWARFWRHEAAVKLWFMSFYTSCWQQFRRYCWHVLQICRAYNVLSKCVILPEILWCLQTLGTYSSSRVKGRLNPPGIESNNAVYALSRYGHTTKEPVTTHSHHLTKHKYTSRNQFIHPHPHHIQSSTATNQHTSQ